MERSKRKLSRVDADVVRAGRCDRGSTIVEILVSIVLLSTAAVAILVALRTSIRASAVDKNLATTYEYVQSVSDQIYDVPRVPCYQPLASVVAAYDAAAKAAPVPVGWSATAKVTEVLFLGKTLPNDPFSWGAFCFESNVSTNQYFTSPLYTQKIKFTVTDPKGGTRTLQVVKSEK